MKKNIIILTLSLLIISLIIISIILITTTKQKEKKSDNDNSTPAISEIELNSKQYIKKGSILWIPLIVDNYYICTKGDRYINLPIDNAEYIVEYNAVLENQEVVSAKKRFIVNFENNDDNNQDL